MHACVFALGFALSVHRAPNAAYVQDAVPCMPGKLVFFTFQPIILDLFEMLSNAELNIFHF